MSRKSFYLILVSLVITAIIISLVISSGIKESKSSVQSISLTQSENEWLQKNKTNITYINDPDFAPASFLDSYGNYTGISEDYIELIEAKLKINFDRIHAATWKEAMDQAKAGKIDIVGAIAVTPERLKFLIFTPPFFRSPSVFLTRKNYPDINERSDLRFKKVAVSESYAIESFLQAAEPLIILVPVLNDLEGLKKVSSGELDAAASDLATASYMIEQSGITNLKIASETGMDYNLCFGINRENPILASIMIKAVNSINDEEIRTIKKKWIQLDFEPFAFSRKLWIAIAFLMLVIFSGSAIFLLWNRSLSFKVDQKTKELSDYKDKLELLVDDRTKKLQDTVANLNEALENIKSLRGLIPICSKCKKIRDDDGYWQQMEEYIRSHSEVEFSHSLCPGCSAELYGDQDWFKKKK